MRSFISSFDFRPLLKAMFGAGVVLAASSAAIPFYQAHDDTLIFGAGTLNELIIDNYITDGRHKPVVVVGSSVATYLPYAPCRPDNVASIYLQGGGAETGLEVIRRVGTVPEVLFVDMVSILNGVDANLIDAAFPLVYWRLRQLIPALRANRNWIVLGYRKIIWDRWQWHDPSLVPGQRTPFIAKYPPMTLAAWNQEIVAPRIGPRLVETTMGAAITPVIASVAQRIRELQRQGTRVYFFNFSDARIRAINPSKETELEIKATLPDVPVIDAPDDQFPIYRTDGLHLSLASGLRLFDYLMRIAGVPYAPKCELLDLPTQTP